VLQSVKMPCSTPSHNVVLIPRGGRGTCCAARFVKVSCVHFNRAMAHAKGLSATSSRNKNISSFRTSWSFRALSGHPDRALFLKFVAGAVINLRDATLPTSANRLRCPTAIALSLQWPSSTVRPNTDARLADGFQVPDSALSTG
jgi:hypothetical protein